MQRSRCSRSLSLDSCLALVAALGVLAAPLGAGALLLSTDVSASMPLDGPHSGNSDNDSDSGPGATVAASSASDTTIFSATYPTLFDGFATAEVTPDSMRVQTSLLVSDYTTAITAEGAFTNAFAVLFRDFDPLYDPRPTNLFFSPVFQLEGSIQASAPVSSNLFLEMTAYTLTDFTTGTLVDVDAPSDGSTLAVPPLGIALALSPIPVPSGDTLSLELYLGASTDLALDPGPAADGDYFGSVDLGSTLTLAGLTAFEDAAGTVPYTGSVSIVDEFGNSVPFVVVPEPGTAGLLALGLVALAVRARPLG